VRGLLEQLLEAQDRGVLTFVIIYEPRENLIKRGEMKILGTLDRVRVAVSGDHFVGSDSKNRGYRIKNGVFSKKTAMDL